ncbi:MAG TPA: hypothetical protein VMS73_10365 [Anaerolineaceae bacterium]|nr:hypothetical protein [Anaerolineaceae bacterium]
MHKFHRYGLVIRHGLGVLQAVYGVTMVEFMGRFIGQMVCHYAQIAEKDVAQGHRKASPADN